MNGEIKTMSKNYIGIDPGKNGSVAVIDSNRKILLHTATPIIKLKKREYDIITMRGLLYSVMEDYDIELCVIEKSQAMPGQGVTSMFSIGKGYGIWLGLLTSLSIPFIEIHPRVWTRKLLEGTGLEGKERNYAKAIQLFPKFVCKYKYEKEYADSLLLAEYARTLNHV